MSKLFRLIFTVILLPILQTFNFCLGIGVNFKDMAIAVKNDEINVLDCQHYNVGECVFDENSNQNMSCVFLNYLTSRDYTLVSILIVQIVLYVYLFILRTIFEFNVQ